MIRQLNIFTMSFIVCTSIAIAFADGPHPVPETQYGELKNQLNISNMERAFGSKKIEVLDIISATEQAYNGRSYNILATISIDGKIAKKCCFVAHNFFPRQQGYIIIKATVGVKKC